MARQALNPGDEVLIRDDNGKFTLRGVFVSKPRYSARVVEYSIIENGAAKTVTETFDADDILVLKK